MISRSRLKRAEAALVELRRDPRAEALALANDIIETLVAIDLLHVELGHERPTDRRKLLDHVATLWLKHANELGVPNDGSAEQRIIGICHSVTDDRSYHAASEPGALVTRLTDSLRA